jgi:hypothetical protein
VLVQKGKTVREEAKSIKPCPEDSSSISYTAHHALLAARCRLVTQSTQSVAPSSANAYEAGYDGCCSRVACLQYAKTPKETSLNRYRVALVLVHRHKQKTFLFIEVASLCWTTALQASKNSA